MTTSKKRSKDQPKTQPLHLSEPRIINNRPAIVDEGPPSYSGLLQQFAIGLLDTPPKGDPRLFAKGLRRAAAIIEQTDLDVAYLFHCKAQQIAPTVAGNIELMRVGRAYDALKASRTH